MQKQLEDDLEKSEDIIDSVQQSPPKMSSPDEEKSIHQKLYEIYVEECEREPENIQELKSNVNLLEKLVSRESLACLVVNLYPENQGYSLMLRDKSGVCSESMNLPYEQEELLEYFDAEELPPILVTLLENSQINIFHSGCVIAEIRDYRQSGNVESPDYQSKHILLQPMRQTLVCDVQTITSDSETWFQKDNLRLESQMLLPTADPLCLDPSAAIVCTENRLFCTEEMMNSPTMKGNLERYSSSTLSKDEELSDPLYPKLSSLTFQKEKSSETDKSYEHTVSIAGKNVDMCQPSSSLLAATSELDVETHVTENAPEKFDDAEPGNLLAHDVRADSVCGFEFDDEYQKPKRTVMQTHNDPFISGERPRKKARRMRWMSLPPSFTYDLSCTFVPGSDTDIGGEVSWSEELMQRDGNYPMQGLFSSSASPGQFSPGEGREQPETMVVQCSEEETTVRHTPLPMELPSSSERSASGDGFALEQLRCFLNSPSPEPAFISPSLFQTSSVEVNRVTSLPTATISTATSSQRGWFQTTVISSQRTPILSTSLASRRIPVLSSASSSNRAPTLSSIYSSQITSALSAVSSSNGVPNASALNMSRINPFLSTVCSSSFLAPSTFSFSQTTLAPCVISLSQSTSAYSTSPASPETSEWSKAQSSETTGAISTDSSSQIIRFSCTSSHIFGTLTPATISSSPSTLISDTKSSSLRTLVSVTVSSTERTLALTTVSSSKKTTVSTTVKSKKRTLSSRSARSSLRTLAPSTVSSLQRAVAPSIVISQQQSSVLPIIISSQRNLATQIMTTTTSLSLIRVLNPVYGTQSFVSGSNLVQGFHSMATGPVRIINSTSGQLPSVIPMAVQNNSQVVIQPAQHAIDNAPGLGSFTVVQVPQGSHILSTQQQSQQQLQLYQFILQPQRQYIFTSYPQQSEPQYLITGDLTNLEANVSTQQTIVLNLTGLGSYLQPQTVVLPQAVFVAQSTPGQHLPQQRVQLSAIFQPQQQLSQSQQIHQLVVTTTTTQSAEQPPSIRVPARRSQHVKRSKPDTPKS